MSVFRYPRQYVDTYPRTPLHSSLFVTRFLIFPSSLFSKRKKRSDALDSLLHRRSLLLPLRCSLSLERMCERDERGTGRITFSKCNLAWLITLSALLLIVRLCHLLELAPRHCLTPTAHPDYSHRTQHRSVPPCPSRSPRLTHRPLSPPQLDPHHEQRSSSA